MCHADKDSAAKAGPWLTLHQLQKQIGHIDDRVRLKRDEEADFL
jgi:hypothetical protein